MTQREVRLGLRENIGQFSLLVLVNVFLTAFAVYYFANWMWLSDLWEVR